ncbi:DedA family protein [Streptantibioticus silvisoli]|uniref:DedA family protein n=1 Tax=Streptantibioticus silvisoli TaxID=2705255 RepID=A0ABT6VWN1_9ACTN|nr:DedA family protein [Streptantibioticus silvisoli]MDI5962894.1 DedA family protein [Streptantibioticus silvisoli]
MTTLALGPTWLTPDQLIQSFGLIGIMIVVFAESGLLIGFFLPGDSLLFTSGLLISQHKYLHDPLWLVCLAVGLAAVLGDQAGYLFGRKVGPTLFNRPDSKLFKRENVEKAHAFFEHHGPKSIILARFVPIVRTFTPIIAGVSRMNYRTFFVFNLVGGTSWAAGVTVLGYFLGRVAFVGAHIEAIFVLIVLISVVPVGIEYLRARRNADRTPPPPGPPGSAGPSGPGDARSPQGSTASRAAVPQRGRHRAAKR